jgi:hypothetical protein
MRLTLRTLLAYLDQVLPPEDALDLEQKISNSEYAQQLIQRIQTISHRPRMEAPRVDSRTHLGDPNLVAEYLDSSLEHDKVIAFERALLESDTSLAEVASCHEILSQVLHQPATVPARMRERLYRLNKQTVATDSHEAASLGSISSPIECSSQEPDGESSDAAAEFPASAANTETSPTRVRPSSKTPFPPHVETTTADTQPDASFAMQDLDPTRETPSLKASPTLPPTWVEQRTQRKSRSSALMITSVLTALLALLILTGTGTLQSWMTVARSPTAATSLSPVAPATEPDGENEDWLSGVETELGGGAFPPRNAGLDSAEEAPLSSLPLLPNIVVDGQGPLLSTDRETPPPTAETPSTLLDASRFSPVTLISPDGLVAARPTADSMWTWLQGTPNLVPLQVQNFSVFRSHWSIEACPQVTLMGTSRATFAGLDSQALSTERDAETGLSLHYGKVLIEAAGNPGRHLCVQLGDRLVRLTLLDPDSIVAIERFAFMPPGTDRSHGSRTWVDHVVGVQGRSNFEDASGIRTFAPNTAITWLDGVQHQAGPVGSIPDWIEKNSQLDEIAASQLRRRIAPDESNIDALHRLTHDDRAEIRIPAAEFLAQLGDMAPLLAALEEPRNRPNWRLRLLDFIENQMTTSPEFASAWQKQLTSQGETGSLAFRLWTGFSEGQLEADGASLLVECLDHDSLMIRSLAIRELLHITGTAELYFPDAEADQRFRRVQAWRRRLADHEIRYVTPPAPASLDYSP